MRRRYIIYYPIYYPGDNSRFLIINHLPDNSCLSIYFLPAAC
ncbi:hypothetical protein DCCM_3991 [Desulfocucumis palustris]|uniref:Uncharacterized protein n=1 Tax=Desulfocucumis palustris TaxID=1898651 RepID=A0A2L2XLN8_9FIRM|nr:hypothetical protein DCCM_3991 [Desulfocucumis palustris]